MKILRFLLPLAVLLIALPEAEAQRGGRGDSKRTPTSRKPANDMGSFQDRLWYGAGGIFGFSNNGVTSFTSIGLIPQVGFKFNEWFSAGPRVGLTWNSIKGPTDRGINQRANSWSYNAGLFARAKVSVFYAQAEGLYLNDAYYTVGPGGALVTGSDQRPLTQRDGDVQMLTGVGYNPGLGRGLSSDIGVFYNIFDDVNSNRSPFQFRIILTYNY